jgi:proteasome lid subunit RPN8/RPN11
MITIPSLLMREIYDHAESSYPYECCGLLIGTIEGDQRHVYAVRRCKNLNTERAQDRYDMDPLCQLKVSQEFEGTGREIIGIYHSHPDHPSRASQTDTDRGFAIYSYVIVSVQKGTVASAQSWVINENEGEKRFDEEVLIVDEGDRK